MELLIIEIFKALKYLVIAGVVSFFWSQGKKNAEIKGVKNILFSGFVVCAAISLYTSLTLGNPSCIDQDYDSHGSTCYEYSDDGYEPTTEQRLANFFYYITLLYLPVAMGALSSRKDKYEI